MYFACNCWNCYKILRNYVFTVPTSKDEEYACWNIKHTRWYIIIFFVINSRLYFKMKEQIIYIFFFCIFSETDLQHTFCLLKQKTKQIKSNKQRNITIRYKKKVKCFLNLQMYLQKKTFSLFTKTIQLDDRNAICMSCSCHKD